MTRPWTMDELFQRVAELEAELLRLRARGVADEAAARVVEAARALEAHLDLHSREGAGDVRTCINCYHRRRDMQRALAATRAGNETNQAGEEAIFEAPVRETAGHAGTSDAATPSSPATSTAEASDPTLTPEAVAQNLAWSYSLSDAARDHIAICLSAGERRHKAKSARLRSELEQADAAKERALAERDEAQRDRQAEHDRRVSLAGEVESLRDRAAQPARQPAASGERVEALERVASAAQEWADRTCDHHERLWDRVGECAACDRITDAEDVLRAELRTFWAVCDKLNALAARAAAGDAG